MGTTGIKSFSFTVPADWGTNSPDGGTSYYYLKIAADGLQGAHVDQVSLLAYAGGGTPTPEFSTIAYIITFGLGGLYIVSHLKKTGSTGIAI